MQQKLTTRELNVLKYLVQGFTNQEISNKLHISVHTVKAHLETIYEKLSVTNRVQACVKGVLLNLIDVSYYLSNKK